MFHHFQGYIPAPITPHGIVGAGGGHTSLAEDTAATNRRQQPESQRRETEEHIRKVFIQILPQWNLIHSFRWVTSHYKVILILLADKDSKTGTAVVDVLRSKHTNPISPALEELHPYASTPYLVNLDIMSYIVEKFSNITQGVVVWESLMQRFGRTGNSAMDCLVRTCGKPLPLWGGG